MNNLLRLIGRRLAASPIMIIDASFLVFFIVSLSPIDLAYSTLGETTGPEALEAYRIEHGLDKPFFVQYSPYPLGILHGNLDTYGVDTSNRVLDLVIRALPVTFRLTFLGLFFAILFAFPLGVLAAIYRDHWPDWVIRIISVVPIGTPFFWLAALLILGFVGKLPVSEAFPAFSEDLGGWFLRMLLPATALAVPVVGQVTCVVRTPIIEELDRDYVHTALNAGIPKWIIVVRNILHDTLIAPVTVLGLRIGYLMGGAVVVEIISTIDGMSRTVFLKGIRGNWVTLMQGGTLVVMIALIIVNIVIDMLCLLVNSHIGSV